MDAHDIEVVKENFRPLKAGRTDLSGTVRRGLSSRPEDDITSTEWERRIIAEASSADPLAVWKGCVHRFVSLFLCNNMLGAVVSNSSTSLPLTSPPIPYPSRYASWLEASSSSNTKPVLDLLERATRTFVSDARYRNDSRYVELWIAYADLLPEPADVFKFMHSNHIGEDVALFYMAWAWVAETANNFVLADKIFERGTARRAAPTDRLAPRYAQFQRRMYRRSIDTLTADAKAAATRAGAPEPKVDLALLTAAAGGLTSASATAVAAAASRDENGRAADVPRAALGRITASAAARSHRPTSYADDAAYRNDADALQSVSASLPVVRQGVQGAVMGPRHTTAAPSLVAPSRPTSNVSIPIFEDEGFSGVDIPAVRPAPRSNVIASADELGVQRPLQVLEARVSMPWTEFGTEVGRRKENSEAPAKWSEAGPLPEHAGVRPASSFAVPLWAQRDPVAAASAARAHETGGRIQIFVDEPAVAPVTVRVPIAPLPVIPRPAVAVTLPAPIVTTIPIAMVDGPSFEEIRAMAWARMHATDAAFITSCITPILNGTLNSIYMQAPAPREAARRAAAAADARAAVASAIPNVIIVAAAATSEVVAKVQKIRATGASISAGNRRQTFAAPTGELLRRYGYDAPAAGVASSSDATARGGDSTAELPAGLRFSEEQSIVGNIEATARLSTLDELFAKGMRVSAAPSVASPVGPSTFSPAALASSRGPRESMLNRLFEDVDGEEAPLDRGGRASLPLDASDVSSIAGDGTTIGGVAVTGTYSFPIGGFGVQPASVRPAAAFAIFSDFTATTAEVVPVPMTHIPLAPVRALFDAENAPKVTTIRAAPLPTPNTSLPGTGSSTSSVSLFKVGPRSVARETPATTFEDVTLHTRLAMDDLDGLFASPRRAPLTSSAAARVAFAFAPASSSIVPAPIAVVAPLPSLPVVTAMSPVADVAAGGPSAIPAKRTRALPPDARRLSMGFSSLASRRQSGMGGRNSLSLMPPLPAAPLGGGTLTILEEENQSLAVIAKKPIAVAPRVAVVAPAREAPPDNFDIENALGRVVPRAINGSRVLGLSTTAIFEPMTSEQERASRTAALAFAGLSGVRHPYDASNQFIIAEDE
jgi:hypothetical protein